MPLWFSWPHLIIINRNRNAYRFIKISLPIINIYILVFSGSCRDMYGREDRAHALIGEVTRALCTSEYSDISPLTGGNIAFSTLEGRNITAKTFESSHDLQVKIIFFFF